MQGQGLFLTLYSNGHLHINTKTCFSQELGYF